MLTYEKRKPFLLELLMTPYTFSKRDAAYGKQVLPTSPQGDFSIIFF